jgi:hypothetical protein
MKEYFYCYSKNLYYFLLSFDEKSEQKRTNKNTGVPYYKFKKSERLDSIIVLYNKVKHSINW